MRLKDAQALLGRKRWSAAYYLSGYVIECSLKCCLLKHLGESNAVFGTRDYLKRVAAECWTHDLVKLVELAGLDTAFQLARNANPTLGSYWGVTKMWKETSRYEEKTETEAKDLFAAVSHKPDGVFTWIQSRW